MSGRLSSHRLLPLIQVHPWLPLPFHYVINVDNTRDRRKKYLSFAMVRTKLSSDIAIID